MGARPPLYRCRISGLRSRQDTTRGADDYWLLIATSRGIAYANYVDMHTAFGPRPYIALGGLRRLGAALYANIARERGHTLCA